MIRYTGEGPLLGLLAFDHLLTRQEECSIEFHSEQSKAARFKVGVGVNRLYINTTASTPGLTPWLAINLSTLSTSAPVRCVGVDRNVFRRGTCDRGDLDEVACVCGGRGGAYLYSMGFQWPFRHLIAQSARSQIVDKGAYSTARSIIAQKRML